MPDIEWVPGDALGVVMPAHGEALRAGGVDFLTTALQASGALTPDNRVARILQLEELQVGGTGSKVLLSVAYENPAAELPTDLFVKFSRNFGDPMRDRLRHMMESEVQFASLSRTPGFPIAVPRCVFADFHRESGTGILMTERVAFGTGKIEPHYQKCLDYEMPESLEHYEALIKALARLAGTHKAGKLDAGFDRQFPLESAYSFTTGRIPHDASSLQRKIDRFCDFAARFPHLLPENIAAPSFTSKLSTEMLLFLKHELAIKHYLRSQPRYIALCHWNANIDNAWFWRNDRGELECGLMDWACVGQMTLVQSILGGLSGAERELWDRHLDEILALFVSEFSRCGGPALDVEELKLQLHLITAVAGLAHLMDGAAIIQAQLPSLTQIESRFDQRFRENETARVQLHMTSMFLNQWQTQDFGMILDRFLRRAGA